MTILILNSLYHPNVTGGAERSVKALAEGLIEMGLNPVVVSTGETDRTDKVDGVRCYYVKAPNLYWMYKAKEQKRFMKPLWHLMDSCNPLVGRKLKEIVHRETPDIMHTNNLAGLSVYAWRLACEMRLPVIHTIRDYYLLCPRATMYRKGVKCGGQCLSCRMYAAPRKALSRNVAAVVGISRFILDRHLRCGYFSNAQVKACIHNPAQGNAEGNRGEDSPKRLRFGFAGLLAPLKGIELLLDSFSNVPPLKAELRIFGRGITEDYEASLRRKYRASNVHFMGFRNPEEIYFSSDVLIVPSLWDEPFARVIAEAYSHGLPVIASNRGGMPEIVRDGQTGFIFDPDRHYSLLRAIMRFIDMPGLAAQMRPSVLERAKDFLPMSIAEQYSSAYTEVLDSVRMSGQPPDDI